MDLGTTIALIGAVGALAATVSHISGYRRGLRKEGAEGGAIKQDVEYIKRGVDDIRIEQRAMRESMSELAERVTRVEESTKQAHKRIDRVEGK